MVKVFSTEHLNNVFSSVNYEGFKNLMFDVADGREIVEDGKVISVANANEKIRTVCFNILGINENSSRKEIKRAMQRHGLELFEVIEEIIEMKVATGWKDSEFFNNFVEEKNLALGDKNEFWTDDKCYLSVEKMARGHHDLNWRVRIA